MGTIERVTLNQELWRDRVHDIELRGPLRFGIETLVLFLEILGLLYIAYWNMLKSIVKTVLLLLRIQPYQHLSALGETRQFKNLANTKPNHPKLQHTRTHTEIHIPNKQDLKHTLNMSMDAHLVLSSRYKTP